MNSLPGFMIRPPCHRLTIELHTKDRRLRGCALTFWGWLVPAVPLGCPLPSLYCLEDPNMVFLYYRMQISRASDPLSAELEWDPSGSASLRISPIIPYPDEDDIKRVLGGIKATGLVPLGRPKGSCEINSPEQTADKVREKMVKRILDHEAITQPLLADALNLSESHFKAKLRDFHLSWKTLRCEAYALAAQASKKS